MSHELRLTGYSALITTEETDAETALTTYRRLAFGGRLNAASKAFLGDSSLRSDYRNRPKEKGFIIFLGMIIRQSIYLTLQQEAEKTKTAVPLPEVAEAIDELEKISVVRYANGRYSQRTPLTRVQKQILSAFGLDHSAVTGKIKALAERLTSCAAEARKSPKKATSVNDTCSI
ncbi:MAG: hypothetical protein IJ088_03860 [Clostridia bacterium]|nr:hypothetical protein [Clostridia bacterium]